MCVTDSRTKTITVSLQHSLLTLLNSISFFFFFNDTATTEIYTLSLHDALPIFLAVPGGAVAQLHFGSGRDPVDVVAGDSWEDRKSTRLNSSHGYISYAVFCLKKKKHLKSA